MTIITIIIITIIIIIIIIIIMVDGVSGSQEARKPGGQEASGEPAEPTWPARLPGHLPRAVCSHMAQQGSRPARWPEN